MDLKNILSKHYPKFETQIPSNKKSVFFRPLIVKEEKKLLTVQEFGTDKEKMNCIVEVLEECFNYPDIKKLTVTDIQYLFIKLRIVSIGNNVTPTLICPFTNENIKLNIDLDTIVVTPSKNKSNTIEISDKVSITLQEPTAEMILNNEISQEDSLLKTAISCIVEIETENEKILSKDQSTEELENFINAMTRKQFSKLVNYFENMSKIEKTIQYKTSDNTEREITLKGIPDFFV